MIFPDDRATNNAPLNTVGEEQAALRMNRSHLDHVLKLPTKPGYVHEGPWPYPDSDKRRAYMRNYMRERRGVRERKRKSAVELREYKRNWMREWREAHRMLTNRR